MSSLRQGAVIISRAAQAMPISAGIYKMIDKTGQVLYVGKAKNLGKRVVSYSNVERLPYRLQLMVSQVVNVEILTTQTEAEALLLEASLISAIKPKFNILLKDDKVFPYIVIEMDHPFPRITKYRGKKQTAHNYFGPFASASSVQETIYEIQKIFRIRPCSNNYFASRTRPCLQYQIKRCTAPCVNKISEQDYSKLVQASQDFLNGKNTAVQEALKQKMLEASERMDYELAAEYRDRIALFTQMQAKNILKTGDLHDADFIGYYNDGQNNTCLQLLFIRNGRSYGSRQYFLSGIEEGGSEIIERMVVQIYQAVPAPPLVFIPSHLNSKLLSKALSGTTKVQVITPKGNRAAMDIMDFAVDNARTALRLKLKEQLKHIEMLAKIRQLFGIKEPIKRVEIYDNSHIQGQNAVGCCVVVGASGFIRNQYRIYKIRHKDTLGDDYAMLREVLKRRLTRMDDDNRPNLMLIDGGKGHLSVAMEVLQDTGIAVACIAKGVDRNAGREFFFAPEQAPFQLPKRDPVLLYLQNLRNEAHRFAITTHRKQRAKAITKSGLEAIPGIGVRRKKALLLHFGSVEQIKAARIEDITRVLGINSNIAKTIYNYLHEDENI